MARFTGRFTAGRLVGEHAPSSRWMSLHASSASGRTRTGTFAHNVLVSFSTHVGSTLAILAVTPFFVSKLGLEAYGLWALLSSVVRYAFLADFGLGPTITKFVAEYAARGERQWVREIVTFGSLFSLGVGTIAVLAVWFAAPHILSIFRIAPTLRVQSSGLLTALTAYLFLYMAGNVLAAVLKGIGRLDISAKSAAIAQLVFAATGVAFVFGGFGVYGLLYATYIQLAVATIMNYAYIRRDFGVLFCNPFVMDWHRVPRLFGMSLWIQLSILFAFAGAETDTVVVGAVVGVATVAIFDIGSKLARALSAVAFHFNAAFLPAISALEVEEGTERTHAAAVVGSRYLGTISLFITGLLVSAAPLILKFWLGSSVQSIHQIALVVVFMSLTFVTYNVIGATTTVLRAIGKPGLEAFYSASSAVVKLLLLFVLARKFALPGVLWASLASAIFSSLVFGLVFAKRSPNWFPSIRNWMPRAVATTLTAVAPVAYVVSLLGPAPHINRLIAFALLMLAGCLYLALFTLGLYLWRFLSEQDLHVVRRLIPSGLQHYTNSPYVRALFSGARSW